MAQSPAYDTHIPQITANNPGIYFVHDPAYYRRLEIESTLGGSVTDPGEGDFLYEFDDVVWVFAEADPCYVFVDYFGSYSTSQNPMQVPMQEDYSITARFESQLDTIYVDDDAPNDPGPDNVYVSDPREDGTADHPFDRIQKAISVAAHGASIAVRPGRYSETIDFGGKSIRLTSTDSNGPHESDYPIVDGAGRGPVVSFVSGEDPNCTMTGFIITGGRGQEAEAILCSDSSPTITNCLIVGNRSNDPNGAAIYCANSSAIFNNCTVADNYGGAQGAGLRVVDSHVVVVNSIIWGNATHEIVAESGADALADYTDVAGDYPGLGNIDTAPLFTRRGYWASADQPEMKLGPDTPGTVWVAGDYHLRSEFGRWAPEAQTWVLDAVTSPCIDAGDPLDAIGEESIPNGGVVNMGAYGGTTEASRSD